MNTLEIILNLKKLKVITLHYKKKFSIIIPVYYNEENLPYTIPRLQKLSNMLDFNVEFIFIDDGSMDNSLKLLLNYRESDSRIKIIKLSKNVGSMSAIQAGISFAQGDCIGIISADLQDPPELFIEMINEWNNGKKVVIAVREDREEGFLQKLFSNTYYFMMDKFAIKGYPKGGFDFVLIDKQVATEINNIKEKNTNIMSLIFWLGYEKTYVYYVRKKREHGTSKWTFSKKIKLFIDSFIAFSYMPIRLISFLGIVMATIGFIYGLLAVINRFLNSTVIEGWTAIIVILTVSFGLIMIMLGIIGEYVWRILDETRKRPSYVIDEIYK